MQETGTFIVEVLLNGILRLGSIAFAGAINLQEQAQANYSLALARPF